jgi:hypothetical protein
MEIEVTICRIGNADPVRNVYDLAASDAMVQHFEKLNQPLYGQLAPMTEGDTSDVVNLSKVTHVVKSMYVVGREVRAKVKLLDTFCGREVKLAFELGFPLNFRPRVIGHLRSDSTFDLLRLVSVDVDYNFYSHYERHQRLISLLESMSLSLESKTDSAQL